MSFVMSTPLGADPALDYPSPDVEALVWATIKGLGGVTSWAYASNTVSAPTGWLMATSMQVDCRARNKAAARAKADQVRRIVSALPWGTWPEGVVVNVEVLSGPFWLPDLDGCPRYVARYAITVHPRPAYQEGGTP